MRVLAFLPLLLLAACSSSSSAPDRAADSSAADQKAASSTDKCLDNPDLAKTWGECNVKSTVFNAQAQLEKCRKANPSATGTVSFELRVMPDGKVKSARPVGSAHHGKHTACVARVFRRLQFAPPPAEATITVPYQLEP